MSPPQRIAQYFQRLGHQRLIQPEERDDRPADAPPRAPELHYATWNATSFSDYVPFRGPTDG